MQRQGEAGEQWSKQTGKDVLSSRDRSLDNVGLLVDGGGMQKGGAAPRCWSLPTNGYVAKAGWFWGRGPSYYRRAVVWIMCCSKNKWKYWRDGVNDGFLLLLIV